MKTMLTVDPVRFSTMTTAEVRQNFLIGDLFQPGRLELAYWECDRTVIGGAMPTAAPLTLEAGKELASAYFTERREIGIMNLGGTGSVTVEGVAHVMQKCDVLYVGRGNRSITFSSASAQEPACFYLLSYPAHTAYPTALARKADATPARLGSKAEANERTIYKYIHPAGIKSCQLVMGYTDLEEGCIWNTMKPHTHMRRTEVYLYFDVPENHAVFHLLGPPDQTRHLVMRNREAALSPIWSIHSGAGTKAYRFVWGMGGENQEFADMDHVEIRDLR
jgi:4-deoxy-L-threo-5-hexosulose-uronate ketol-isomerase